MEYEMTVKDAEGKLIMRLHSDERKHARGLRGLADVPENGIAVEVNRTSRREVRFAGIDEPKPLTEAQEKAKVKRQKEAAAKKKAEASAPAQT